MRLHASLCTTMIYTILSEWRGRTLGRVQWNFDVVPERGASAAVAEL